jgi:hypothetical protein
VTEERNAARDSLDLRRFSESEVRAILKKAVEDPSTGSPMSGDGLSLDELKAAGVEVGIDPSRIERAARSIVSDEKRSANPLIGTATVLNVERTTEGEIGADRTPQVLAAIRKTMGTRGSVSEVRGSLEWSAKGELGERFVTIASTGGKTTITGSANLANAAMGMFIPAGVFGLFGSIIGVTQAAEAGNLVAMVLFLALVPVLYFVLRQILKRISRHEEARLGHLVEELTKFVEVEDVWSEDGPDKLRERTGDSM